MLAANVFGAPPPGENAAGRLIQCVDLPELSAALAARNPGYGLRWMEKDFDRLNQWEGPVHTRLLYHLRAAGGRVQAGPHAHPILSGNPELAGAVLALAGPDRVPISQADITVLVRGQAPAQFHGMDGHGILVLDYAGPERMDALGARHCRSWRLHSRRGGCAQLDNPALFRKLPLLAGTTRTGDPADETTEPGLVADIHPVHIRGGAHTPEHWHRAHQEELYFTGCVLRGPEQADPHVLFQPGHVRPPAEREIPSFVHVHAAADDPYSENWRLREGDICFIPAGMVHRAQGSAGAEGGALVGVAAIPWFITHNELTVEGLD